MPGFTIYLSAWISAVFAKRPLGRTCCAGSSSRARGRCCKGLRQPVQGVKELAKALELIPDPLCLVSIHDEGHFDELIGQHQVIGLDWSDDEDRLIEAYTAADFFVMPSTAEAFGMMAVEAMACGKPVVVFEGTSLPEVTFAPDCGIAVPMRDVTALAQAIAHLVSGRSGSNQKRIGRSAPRGKVPTLRNSTLIDWPTFTTKSRSAVRVRAVGVKILLLTDVPPCTNYTAGMVLSQIIKMLPIGSVACFSAVNPDIQNFAEDPELAWMPLEYAAKPRENGFSAGIPMRWLLSYMAERARLATAIPDLMRRIIDFGKRQKVDAVWAVLQGQTMVRLSHRVADDLKCRYTLTCLGPTEVVVRRQQR